LAPSFRVLPNLDQVHGSLKWILAPRIALHPMDVCGIGRRKLIYVFGELSKRLTDRAMSVPDVHSLVLVCLTTAMWLVTEILEVMFCRMTGVSKPKFGEKGRTCGLNKNYSQEPRAEAKFNRVHYKII